MTVTEYNQCVELYADGVYRFILKNIRDDERARDIVQDSYTRMWEKAKTIAFEKARSYLFTTAYHTMIDAARKDKHQQKYQDHHNGDTHSENEYSDLQEILTEAIEKLPELQRSVLMLRDYEGYAYKEIGDITGLNESQVKVYIYRGRMTLKEIIGSIDAVV